MQMALGQALFDAALSSHQPVHGGVQFILVDGARLQHVTETADEIAQAGRPMRGVEAALVEGTADDGDFTVT